METMREILEIEILKIACCDLGNTFGFAGLEVTFKIWGFHVCDKNRQAKYNIGGI
jgi:hypothetical protein